MPSLLSHHGCPPKQLNLLIAIMASTFAAIEQTQTAQYQLLRIRVLNEFLTMPMHERFPPPFNLIAVTVSVPLRYLASFISEERRQQSALYRIAFWLIKALYTTIDAILYAIAFTPAQIYTQLERIPSYIQQGRYCWALQAVCSVFLMPLPLLYQLLAPSSLTEFSGPIGGLRAKWDEMTDDEKAEMRRFARYGPTEEWYAQMRRYEYNNIKGSIDKSIAAADHHDSNFPDVMTALNIFQEYVKDEVQPVLQDVQTRMTDMETHIKTKMGIRLTRMERNMERLITMKTEMETDIKVIKAKLEEKMG